MPMIWTAGNLAFLVFVAAAIAFLIGSEILEAQRSQSRRVRAVAVAPESREPWRRSGLPAAVRRRIGID
jgi:hypothetical protein